ncbi:MAG: hypothetical protein AAGG08_09970, partial [Actinomycetota bacterium]
QTPNGPHTVHDPPTPGALMSPIALTSLIVVANVVGAAMALPQAVRLIRTRDASGVSSVWAGVSVAMNVWWLAYGLAERLWGLVPVSIVGVGLYLVIAGTLVRLRGRATVGALGAGVLLASGPLPVLLLAGWPAAGVAIGLGYGLQLAPAVVAAHRTRQLAGVSPATWLMAWTESAAWVAYGIAVVDPALLVGGAGGVLLPSLMLLRLALTGHRPLHCLLAAPVRAVVGHRARVADGRIAT